jgi:hypothetical protein
MHERSLYTNDLSGAGRWERDEDNALTGVELDGAILRP